MLNRFISSILVSLVFMGQVHAHIFSHSKSEPSRQIVADNSHDIDFVNLLAEYEIDEEDGSDSKGYSKLIHIANPIVFMLDVESLQQLRRQESTPHLSEEIFICLHNLRL